MAELIWLSGELDPARNLDVFLLGAFRRASRGKRDKAELAVLRQRLSKAREGAYARARSAAESDRFSALLLDVLTWIEVGPWTRNQAEGAATRDGQIGGFAALALEKGRRKVEKRGRGFAHLSREARHNLRIRAKTLRYAAEVFADLFPGHAKPARRFVDRLKALLDCLGELNDIATSEGLIADGPCPGRLAGQQASREKRLIGLAGEALDEFGESRRFWSKPP